PGLANHTNYYVINVPGQPNEIQLAATRQDALNGQAITFGSYPYLAATLNGASVNLPITQVDDTTNALKYDYSPGFTSGATVTYHAAPGQSIANLVDGSTYVIKPSSEGPVQTAAATLDSDKLAFTNFDPGLTLQSQLVYKGATDPSGNPITI